MKNLIKKSEPILGLGESIIVLAIILSAIGVLGKIQEDLNYGINLDESWKHGN